MDSEIGGMNDVVNAREYVPTFRDLFFSKTDFLGNIVFGNHTFERISGFKLQDMKGRPHSIIRHPEMPKAVFYLLWEFIKKGKPISAYVKNRAKDGTAYWVFASAFPGEKYHTSVRIKPSLEIVPLLNSLYGEMLSIEKKSNPKDAIQNSVTFLMAELEKLGFQSYEDFMTERLIVEVKVTTEHRHQWRRTAVMPENAPHKFFAIDRLLTKTILQAETLFASFIEIHTKFNEIKKELKEVSKLFSNIEYCSLNMSLKASKLGSSAKPISVIANTFGEEAQKVQETIAQAEKLFQKSFLENQNHVYSFGSVLKKVLIEECFLQENSFLDQMLLQESIELHEHVLKTTKLILSESHRFGDKFWPLTQATESISRQIKRLEAIYQLGTVEVTHCDGGAQDLRSQLEVLKNTVLDSSKRIMSLKESILKSIDRVEGIGNRSKDLHFLVERVHREFLEAINMKNAEVA